MQPQRTVQENPLTDWRRSLAYKKQLRWVRQSFSLSLGIRHDEYSPVTWTAGRVNNAANVNSQAPTHVIRIRQYWDAPRNPRGFDTLFSNGHDVRFNVSNVLDEEDVVYSAYTSNAAAGGDVPNTFRYQTPRKYSLTATFNF